MCVFRSPSIPAAPLPLPPAAPPPQPQRQDPAVAQARKSNRQQAARAQGRGSTILTSGLGLTTEASTTKKQLLGS